MQSKNQQTQTQFSIEHMLRAEFSPSVLQVHNESHQHAGPANDSHFKVVIVSDCFVQLSLIARHRLVYKALSALMPQPVHALALHTYTADEWAVRDLPAPESPECRGGSSSKTE